MITTENAFAEWLRRQRRQLDLTQAELAQRAGCSVMTIRKLERAELRPSKQLAELLARALDIAPAHQAAVVAFARGTGTYPQPDSAEGALAFPVHPVDLPLRKHNLDGPTTPLIGRERELADLQQLFARPDVRLVTIVGAGGMGKTHLAQAFARAHHDRSQGQVFFVALAALFLLEGLATTIIDALGYPLQPDQRSPEQQLLDYLQPKTMLLVLDNFEHLLAGVGLVNAILRVAPAVKLLVTSRERLFLSSEILYVLGSLTYPSTGAPLPPLDYGAVKLLLQRVHHLRPRFQLQEHDHAALLRICQLVEGMPLGILLAAAWVDLLPFTTIADEISRSLDFLTTELRDLPERHHSIRAVFAQSWQRLPDEARTVFRQLAVFRGGFTRHAAQCVAGASLHNLRTLVNQSLLQVDRDERYTLHELLRQYADNELLIFQQSDQAHTAHSAYYLALLAQLASDLKGPQQAAILTTIETEYENVRVAWTWAVAQRHAQQIAQAVESLGFFHEWRGRSQEGERFFAQAALAFAQPQSSVEQDCRLRLLTWQATFQQVLGRSEQARDCLYQALEQLNHIKRTEGAAQLERAAILHGLGIVAYDAGDRQTAGRLFAESSTLYRAGHSRWGEAKVLLSWEGIDRNLPDLANPDQHRQATNRSKVMVMESLAIFRQCGDLVNSTMALSILAAVYLTLGQAKEASQAITECLAIQERLHIMNHSVIDTLIHLGIAYEYSGLYEQMYSQAQQVLAMAQAVSDINGTRRAYFLLTSTLLVQQRFTKVAPYFHEATRLLGEGRSGFGLTVLLLVNCGFASYRLGNLPQAQHELAEALHIGQGTRSIRGTVHGLLLGALLLAESGKLALAAEIHALALRYPFVANSRWCEDVAGRELVAVTASLPAAVVETARIRGQASDLWATAAALLVELAPYR